MSTISIQLSLYPLRQSDLRPAIEAALEAFRTRQLDVTTGPMSTLIVGESDVVFEALREAFVAADAVGDIVMITSISNCCPLPSPSERSPDAGGPRP